MISQEIAGITGITHARVMGEQRMRAQSKSRHTNVNANAIKR
jgi:hypothetical protein